MERSAGGGSIANGLNDILAPSLLPLMLLLMGGSCETPALELLKGRLIRGEEEACAVAGSGSGLATDLIRSKTRARVWPSVAALR